MYCSKRTTQNARGNENLTTLLSRQHEASITSNFFFQTTNFRSSHLFRFLNSTLKSDNCFFVSDFETFCSSKTRESFIFYFLQIVLIFRECRWLNDVKFGATLHRNDDVVTSEEAEQKLNGVGLLSAKSREELELVFRQDRVVVIDSLSSMRKYTHNAYYYLLCNPNHLTKFKE